MGFALAGLIVTLAREVVLHLAIDDNPGRSENEEAVDGETQGGNVEK